MLSKTCDIFIFQLVFILGECDRPKKARLSSVYDHSIFPGEKCIDGIETGGQTNLCHTKKERYPFLVLEYDNPVKVSEVKIYNRDDCCGDRLKNLHVFVTDQYPEVGTMAEGMSDLSMTKCTKSIFCIYGILVF